MLCDRKRVIRILVAGEKPNKTDPPEAWLVISHL